MAVTIPATLQIADQHTFLVPAMAVNPLGDALENGNHLYRYFRPPLVSAMPLWEPTQNRNSSWTFGIYPSADALRYTFEHRVLPAFTLGAAPLTVEVLQNTGTDPAAGWASIYGPTATAGMTNGVWLTHAHTAIVSASARMLRVQYTAAGGNYLPGHILAYPDPNPASAPLAAPYGITSSGFRVWEDSLLVAAGGPVNTEMVDRCRRNAVAVLRDRYQNVLSLLQEDGVSAQPRHQAPSAALAATDWVLVGKGRAFIPWQSAYTLYLRVLASVSGGATTANRVRVSIAGGVSADFNATGLLVDGTLALTGDGGAGNSEDFEIRVRRGDAATTTRLHSVMAFWRPGD